MFLFAFPYNHMSLEDGFQWYLTFSFLFHFFPRFSKPSGSYNSNCMLLAKILTSNVDDICQIESRKTELQIFLGHLMLHFISKFKGNKNSFPPPWSRRKKVSFHFIVVRRCVWNSHCSAIVIVVKRSAFSCLCLYVFSEFNKDIIYNTTLTGVIVL